MTAYKAIRKLEPGHSLRYRKGDIKIERYWQPDFSPKLNISEAVRSTPIWPPTQAPQVAGVTIAPASISVAT